MTFRQIISLVLLAGVFIMEGFDIAAMGIAVPRLEETLGLAPASFGWVTAMRRPAFKARVDARLLRLPLFGRLLRDLYAARFARTRSTMAR